MVLGTTMFFHEPSRIIISPPEVTDTDFGFSVAYQDNINGNLLIGAPHTSPSSMVGEVYVCPIDSIINNRPSCTLARNDLAYLAPDTEYNLINSKQSFCLGASIAAAPDYFVSCAPLWSTKVHLLNGKSALRSVGTCFIYKGTNTTRFNGIIEQYNHPNPTPRATDIMAGETGWGAFFDKTHQKILLGKPSDIVYLDATNPYKKAKSMIDDYFGLKQMTLKLDAKINIGQSVTAGNYFVNSKDIPKSNYAVTMQNPRYLGGEMQFLEYTENKRKRGRLLPIAVEKSISGPRTAMFGVSVFSADVNRDGLDDLLVGAPAHTKDPQSYETGAIFIYLGGNKRIGDVTRVFSILGMEDGSRFGAALAANDIDGDNIPELFVSAPYEHFNLSTGALYVLAGSEIRDIIHNKRYNVNLNDLKYTQKIKVEGKNTFGYTVQVVPDIDSNGCDELAVGSPGSATVILLKCIPRINATLSLTLYKNDKHDIVNVCMNVSYPKMPKKIVTKLKVICEITESGAQILGSNIVEADLTSRLPQYCSNITINYLYEESLSHQFFAKLDVHHLENEFSQYDFNNEWVTLSQYSKTEDSINIMKPCLGNDCKPALEAHFLWANNDQPASDIDYTIGQNETENITLVVVNKGIPTFGCVQLNVDAPATIPCVRDSTGSYLCNLKPIGRDQQETLKMVVKMNEFTSETTLLHIKAKWYPECHNKREFNSTELNIHLKLIPQVYINSTSHYLNITEKDIEEENKTKPNDSNNIIKDIHEYTIINENSVHWINVPAEIRMDKKPFLNSYKMQTTQPSDCKQTEETNRTIFNCILSIKSRSSSKIIIATEILKNKIRDSMKDKKAEMYSDVAIRLLPTDDVIRIDQKTIILLQKETHDKNNKLMTIVIAVIVALLILALISYLLYKVGFFERKSKNQLNTMRESIKRKNSQVTTKHENSSADDEDESDGNNDVVDISVEEENNFEPVSLHHCNIDTTALIETKQEEINEEKLKPKQDYANNTKEVKHKQMNDIELTSRSNDKLI